MDGQTVSFQVTWKTEGPVSLVVLDDETKETIFVEMDYDNVSGTFNATYTYKKPGLYFYHFESGEETLSRNAPGSAGILSRNPNAPWFTQLVYSRDYRAPKECNGRLVYQIFPDRFYRDTVLYTKYQDRVLHENLNDMPHFRPVNGVVKNNDFFGGNLKGIIDKLPYLSELGVGMIYLNPIFESHSNHRYDTADYKTIDPLLGTNEDFKTLSEAAARNGMTIILDGVFSHTGADSVYFDKYGRYQAIGEGAYNNPNSPYRSWYKFGSDGKSYHSWWGFDTLPEVNEDDPGFREFICGDGGVIDYWMSMGAGGFRLDVADELPDDFIEEIRAAIKRHGDDKLFVGEVWENAATKEAYHKRRRYLWGKELDSVMNYPFRTAIIDFVRDADADRFMNRVMEVVEDYPKPMMDVMMNLLSTHDTDRLLTALAKTRDDLDREWQARQSLTRDAYLRSVEMAKLAFALLFTLPGIPTIYYGDEIGMEGYRDPFNRGYFRWNRIDKNLRNAVLALSEKRKENPVLGDGRMIPVVFEAQCVAFLRTDGKDGVFVMVNRSDETRTATVGDQHFEAEPWQYVIEPVEARNLASYGGV